MARPFANPPLVSVVEHQMEAQALLRRAIAELIAANRIVDPLAFTPQQTQQSA